MRAAGPSTMLSIALVARGACADCTVVSRCVRAIATDSATSLVVSSSRVFWTDSAGRIESVSKWGGPTTALARSRRGAVLDGAGGGFLVWHTASEVRRIPENGGANELLYSYAEGNAFVDVAVTPRALWVTTRDAVWRLAPDGTTSLHANGALVGRNTDAALFVGSTGRAWPNAYRLDDGTEIHLSGNPSLAADTNHGMPALFVLAEHRLVRIENGTASVLATQQDAGGRICVIGDSLYWTSPESGVIRKTTIYGGGIDVLAAGQLHPTLIRADADSVYWSSDRAIVRVTPR